MANMSYCRFENTSSDLLDCVREMEQGDFDPNELGEYELPNFHEMKELCERFLEAYDRVTSE